MTARTDRTRQRILRCALDLFVRRGYDETTVNDIAAAAGVSQMTFFRYFPAKEDVVSADPYDPFIAGMVAAQPTSLPPLERSRRGLLTAWQVMAGQSDLRDDTIRTRLQIAGGHPALRARMWESSHETLLLIAAALRQGGTSDLEAHAAAGAVLGAVTSVLLTQGADPALSIDTIVATALDSIAPAEPNGSP